MMVVSLSLRTVTVFALALAFTFTVVVGRRRDCHLCRGMPDADRVRRRQGSSGYSCTRRGGKARDVTSGYLLDVVYIRREGDGGEKKEANSLRGCAGKKKAVENAQVEKRTFNCSDLPFAEVFICTRTVTK